MSTPTLPELRTEADQLLRLTAMSPVSQILAVAIGQANNGTQPDPDASTNSLLEGIRTWQNQAPSDVEAIVANQVMRFLKNFTGLRAASSPITQIIAAGDSFSFNVTVENAAQGDFVMVAPRSNIIGEYVLIPEVTSGNTVTVTVKSLGSLIGVNLSNVIFNVMVLKY